MNFSEEQSQTNNVASTRDKLQLSLPKENDTIEETGKRLTIKENTPQQPENPPKIRES